MIKNKLFILLLVVFSISKVHAEHNLTIQQVENARTLLKEYAFMSCLKEGFGKKIKKNAKKEHCKHNIFRKDLLLSYYSLAKYSIYYIPDNTKQTSAQNLAIYHKVDQFIKENYSKVKRINTPFFMKHLSYKKKEERIFLTCFDIYNSKELNNLIREQDKYINDRSILDDIIVINNEINSTLDLNFDGNSLHLKGFLKK